MVFNLILVATLELGAEFVQTFSQFLALCSPFGIRMGGICSQYRLRLKFCLWKLVVSRAVPPRRICIRLSFCSRHQSFLGSRNTSWVESVVLGCVWHFSVFAGESEILRGKETERVNGMDTTHGFHPWDQGHVEEALATLHLRCTTYDRYVSCSHHTLFAETLLINILFRFQL